MLETRDLTIRFGGHVAVDGVSCAFKPGTLTAIVGPNGAGKTTYFNLISGQLRASAGSVHLDGHDITAESAPQRTHRGLGRAFQLTQLFPNLSVLENVRLAVQSRRREGMNLWTVWSDHRNTLERAHALGRPVDAQRRLRQPADDRHLALQMLRDRLHHPPRLRHIAQRTLRRHELVAVFVRPAEAGKDEPGTPGH